MSTGTQIHPSAVVEPGAEIGEGCVIGPFCIVGAQVTLGPRVALKSHVVVTGHTTVGEDTVIFPFAVIGEIPQDLKFQGEQTRLEIGARNRIREHVTMNTGTAGGGGLTRVGDDGLFMAGCHIAHDCQVGDRVIIVNSSAIAGHCVIEDDVIVGGLCGVHQWVRVGRGAIIGALSMVIFGTVLSATSPRFINGPALRRIASRRSRNSSLASSSSRVSRPEMPISSARRITHGMPLSIRVAAVPSISSTTLPVGRSAPQLLPAVS